jgi:hypothetical protein
MTFSEFRARAARAGLRAPLAWLRHFGLDSSDVFVASYSRSGNTMLRFILGEILSGVPSSFETIQRIVPEMGLQGNAVAIGPGGGRMIKTHEPYRREYRRAIYMIRDVRDVMLSCFSREIAMDVIHNPNLDDYVRPFLQGKMQHFGSWQAHVDSWLNSPIAKSGELLVLRFEDMRRDPEGSVARCLEFLGKKADPTVIQTAIRNNSLERMRAKEDRSKLPKSPIEEGRQIGKGAIEGWRRKLTQRQLDIVDEFAGETLARLHYCSGISSPPEERGRPAINEKVGVPETHANPVAIESVARGPGPAQSGRMRPVATQALRIRIGGRIANSFCWYRY